MACWLLIIAALEWLGCLGLYQYLVQTLASDLWLGMSCLHDVLATTRIIITCCRSFRSFNA